MYSLSGEEVGLFHVKVTMVLPALLVETLHAETVEQTFSTSWCGSLIRLQSFDGELARPEKRHPAPMIAMFWQRVPLASIIMLADNNAEV